MPPPTKPYSPEFQAFIQQVETALTLAAQDARELAERTGTPLVVRESKENGACGQTDSKLNFVPKSGNKQ